MGVALAEDGIFSVEFRLWKLRDEELGAVGIGSCVGHGKASGDVEGEPGSVFVVEEIAGISAAVAFVISTLDHEGGDDPVEGGGVVEAGFGHFFAADRVGPVPGAFGKVDEVGGGDGGLLVEELAGEAAHGGVEDDGRAGRCLRYGWGGGGAGGVWQGCGRGLRGRGLVGRGLGHGSGREQEGSEGKKFAWGHH